MRFKTMRDKIQPRESFYRERRQIEGRVHKWQKKAARGKGHWRSALG